MRIGDRNYSRRELERYIGSIIQLGGTRHYQLTEGNAKGTAAIDFNTSASLPYFSEWKMMGEGDYVVGMEPCNTKCMNRSDLRQQGLLPFLEPGETREIRLEIGVLSGDAEIRAFIDRTKAWVGGSQ